MTEKPRYTNVTVSIGYLHLQEGDYTEHDLRVILEKFEKRRARLLASSMEVTPDGEHLP